MKVLAPAFALLVALAVVGCGKEGAAGTYVLAKDASLGETLGGASGEGVPKEAVDALTRMLDSMSLSLVLEADGTFETEGTVGVHFTGSGTWTLSGKDLTLTTTTTDGRKDDPPRTHTLVYEGNVVRVPKGAGNFPVDLVLRRR